MAALKNHASVVSSSSKVASEEFHRRFAEFVRLFGGSSLGVGYLEGIPTEVTRAYYASLACKATEVRDVPYGTS